MLNLKRILVPVDYSSSDQTALAYATALARDQKAAITVLHVEEPPMAYGGGEMYYGVEQPDREELARMLAKLVPSDPSIDVKHRLLTGDPASVIARAADEERADLIVMGTHGRSGLTRLLMGSVAEVVVRHAKCPVLTVKQPNSAPA